MLDSSPGRSSRKKFLGSDPHFESTDREIRGDRVRHSKFVLGEFSQDELRSMGDGQHG